MAHVPIDRKIDNPDAINILYLALECRPGKDGAQMEPVESPDFPERVVVKGVLYFEQRNEEGEIASTERLDLTNMPMSKEVRQQMTRAFTAWRKEVATMYLRPDNGKQLKLEHGVFVERESKVK